MRKVSHDTGHASLFLCKHQSRTRAFISLTHVSSNVNSMGLLGNPRKNMSWSMVREMAGIHSEVASEIQCPCLQYFSPERVSLPTAGSPIWLYACKEPRLFPNKIYFYLFPKASCENKCDLNVRRTIGGPAP